MLLARIELCSHAPVANLERSGRDATESIGGRRPAGGVNRNDDRETDFPLKSAEHFRRRLLGARTSTQVALIEQDMLRTLQAFQNPAFPSGLEPEPGTIHWKRRIAESSLSAAELARQHGISARTVHRYRAQYARNPD
jgi:hypothetical protein